MAATPGVLYQQYMATVKSLGYASEQAAEAYMAWALEAAVGTDEFTREVQTARPFGDTRPLAEVYPAPERACRYCGGQVESSKPEVDFCRACWATGRHAEEEGAEFLDALRESTGLEVTVWQTGGGTMNPVVTLRKDDGGQAVRYLMFGHMYEWLEDGPPVPWNDSLGSAYWSFGLYADDLYPEGDNDDDGLQVELGLRQFDVLAPDGETVYKRATFAEVAREVAMALRRMGYELPTDEAWRREQQETAADVDRVL